MGVECGVLQGAWSCGLDLSLVPGRWLVTQVPGVLSDTWCTWHLNLTSES